MNQSLMYWWKECVYVCVCVRACARLCVIEWGWRMYTRKIDCKLISSLRHIFLTLTPLQHCPLSCFCFCFCFEKQWLIWGKINGLCLCSNANNLLITYYQRQKSLILYFNILIYKMEWQWKRILILHFEFSTFHLRIIRHSYHFGPYLLCLRSDNLLSEKHLQQSYADGWHISSGLAVRFSVTFLY